MPKYRLRPVVLDHREGIIVHYGNTRELSATEIHAARAEVDRMPVRFSANCLQILDENDRVVTHRSVNSATDNPHWA
jgi:hypothetical protein